MGAHDSKSNDQKNTKTNNPMTTFPLDPVKPRGELFKTKVPEKGEYCSVKEEICGFGSVPFLMGLYEAYCFHCPIKFYPDDFWLLIVQMVSNYINDHSEKMRSKIVDFDGKKTLTALIHKVSLSSLTPDDYKSIIDQLVALIPKNIKDKKLVNTLSPTFSTSDSNNMYVKKLTVMCTFKKYFEYEAEICGCGFPSITLAGEVSDWELILKNLKCLIKLVPDLKSIKAPMEKIVETKINLPASIVNSINEYKDYRNQLAHHGQIDNDNNISTNIMCSHIEAAIEILSRYKEDIALLRTFLSQLK